MRFNPDYKDNGWIFTSKSRHKPDYNGTPLHYSVLNNFLNSPENGKLNRKVIQNEQELILIINLVLINILRPIYSVIRILVS